MKLLSVIIEFFVFFLFVCLMIMPTSYASIPTFPEVTTYRDTNEKNVLNNEELPDLIIEEIVASTGHLISDQEIFCKVKNNGSAHAGDGIEVKVIVRRKILGVVPIPIVFSKTSLHYIGGNLYPDESTKLFLFGNDYFPTFFGVYTIYCSVNPNLKIKELQYDNNVHIEDYFVLLGRWYWLNFNSKVN